MYEGILRTSQWSNTIQGYHGPLVSVIALFSSPEHKVLMVNFCDRPMSVVHNFFKHLLLLNHRANLDETWQGCSLGEALPKLFKRLNSSLVAMATKRQKNAKSLKIFFSETRRPRALMFGM